MGIRNIWFQLPSGAKMSIAVGQNAYCTPRVDDASGYTHVEVGFPTGEIPASWIKYAEDKTRPHDTVYGWLPTELVADWFLVNRK